MQRRASRVRRAAVAVAASASFAVVATGGAADAATVPVNHTNCTYSIVGSSLLETCVQATTVGGNVVATGASVRAVLGSTQLCDVDVYFTEPFYDVPWVTSIAGCFTVGPKAQAIQMALPSTISPRVKPVCVQLLVRTTGKQYGNQACVTWV